METTDEIELLRAVTREAHEALKDLLATIKQAEKVTDQIVEMIAVGYQQHMAAAVDAGLATYGAAIEEAIEKATQATYDRFQTIADMLMGETKKQRRNGPTLTEMAERIIADERTRLL